MRPAAAANGSLSSVTWTGSWAAATVREACQLLIEVGGCDLQQWQKQPTVQQQLEVV